MIQDEEFAPPIKQTGNLSTARFGEVLGVLAAVMPCGILAGLYLASDDPIFLIAGLSLAAVAVGVIFVRNPDRIGHALRRWTWVAANKRERLGNSKVGGAVGTVHQRLQQTFTRRFLKLLGFVAWILVWGVTAAMFMRVAENANIGGLIMFVAIGSLSPLVIYYGLESGVKRLGDRLGREE
jgi:hypothetical protein